MLGSLPLHQIEGFSGIQKKNARIIFLALVLSLIILQFNQMN